MTLPEPCYDRDGQTIYCGDALDILPLLSGISAVVTDPPYELGFMGKSWDRSGVAFQPETWAAVLAACLPGTPLLAFGGTRTYHRLVCAIEDAGWEIRDCLAWVYGSGFPKSLDISKQLLPASERANSQANLPEYDGWGTALKPAHEPICLAMKPLDGTFANNAEKWGVAGLNVDGCRIEAPGGLTSGGNPNGSSPLPMNRNAGQVESRPRTREHPSGRWPANLIWSHHPECVQVGVKKVKGHTGYPNGPGGSSCQLTQKGTPTTRTEAWAGHADADGLETVENWDCHPDCPSQVFPETTSGARNGPNKSEDSKATSWSGGWGHVGGPCSASTGSAARFFYCAKASKSERTANGTVPNGHPTVKPLALMRYLVRLVSAPSGGVVLDPFAGSGSTLIAAKMEGQKAIGIEQSEEFCKTAAGRLDATPAGASKREPQVSERQLSFPGVER